MNESTASATVHGDNGSDVNGTAVLSNNESMAAVRLTVIDQQNDELEPRDEERAGRYVTTVRPAMTALR
ncbi:hypothetical protein PHMEG_0006879 [Phytophthora megakarya]|uniref:Reverse transcriptase n=1 Tax=Phytophthora megakarya TaxID=4795 RepID=A0A225WNS0_9STRA|nr:hypothetical protein PHMEG_0006879 [Phytophthora megakarya]